MRLLLCCEFYYPSVGGVQEVMRQLAERFVARGHTVTVATTRLADRDFDEHNGVRIAEFGIAGNLVRGIDGEIERYQRYVQDFDGDAILIKAAQQWTFDALWPVLDGIRARKVFIPCGFSGLYEPSYEQYFRELPDILRRFDHLIFYAERYRDIDFARQHGLTHWSVLPNGASESEFGVAADPQFRARHGIGADSFVFLTVGSLTGVKGHREILEAFARLDAGGRAVTLILNGNPPPVIPVDIRRATAAAGAPAQAAARTGAKASAAGRLVRGLARLPVWLAGRVQRVAGLVWRSFGVMRREGRAGITQRIVAIAVRKIESVRALRRLVPKRLKRAIDPIAYWSARIERQRSKQLLKVDLPRPELVQAFQAADLFVFASNIEYSPLVLFETAAAGTPFLSVPVGNAEEIARWTGAGVLCPAPKDERGYTRADPQVLAAAMREWMDRPAQLAALGRTGHERWQQHFTWAHIATRYEAILRGEASPATACTYAAAADPVRSAAS